LYSIEAEAGVGVVVVVAQEVFYISPDLRKSGFVYTSNRIINEITCVPLEPYNIRN
jgi:hypothetical protein